jgi:hypothetical protein
LTPSLDSEAHPPPAPLPPTAVTLDPAFFREEGRLGMDAVVAGDMLSEGIPRRRHSRAPRPCRYPSGTPSLPAVILTAAAENLRNPFRTGRRFRR